MGNYVVAIIVFLSVPEFLNSLETAQNSQYRRFDCY